MKPKAAKPKAAKPCFCRLEYQTKQQETFYGNQGTMSEIARVHFTFKVTFLTFQKV